MNKIRSSFQSFIKIIPDSLPPLDVAVETRFFSDFFLAFIAAHDVSPFRQNLNTLT